MLRGEGVDYDMPHRARTAQEHVATLPKLQERLESVCDVKEGFDEPVVRLNDAKLLEWLRRKTGALQKHLQVPPRSAAPSHG